MNRLTILLISMFLLLFSACTVLPAVESANPEAPAAPTEAVVDPVQAEQPESNIPATGAPATQTPASSAGDGAQPNTGATPALESLSAEEFDARLAQLIEAKDYQALHRMMGEQFVLAGWRSEGAVLPPFEAMTQLSQGALGPGAGPAVSFGVDTSALLEGADPLAFFPPDAVRAFYVDFVGPNGTDQALAIVGRDPVTGRRYWKGLLVAMGGFRQDGASQGDLEQFSQQLTQAVEQRDFAAMRALMANEFAIAVFNRSLTVRPADEMFDQLRGGIFAAGSTPAFRLGTDLNALLSGRDPLGEWGPVAQPVRALHLMGLGSTTSEEAVLVIARDGATGKLVWHGVLLPPNGRYFTAHDVSDDIIPTDVRYVMAMEDVNVRSGPGLNYAVEGQVRAGQIALVTGKSVDAAWWQIECTQDASGRCWISARADLTQPTTAP